MRINEMPDGVIKWEGGQGTMVIIHVCWGVVGFLAASTILASHIRLKNSANMLLTLCLSAADLYFITSVLVFGFINIPGGGWSSGRIGCIIDAFIVCSSCFCSILTLLFVTLERYLQVVHSQELSKSRAWKAIIGLWTLSFILGGLPLITNTFGVTYGLQSSNLLCVFSWWDVSPAQIVMHVTSFSAIGGCLTVMIFCYTNIFLKFRQTVRSVGSATKSDTQVSGTKEKEGLISKKEMQLLIKSVVLTFTYVLGWSPYMIKIIVEIATQRRVPSEWEFFCQMCVLTNSTMNSFLMMLLDARIKQNVINFLTGNSSSE
jgi:hypothetical protein